MAKSNLTDIYEKLYAFCEGEGFAGWDPFDGLESRFFRLLPFRKRKIVRQAWLQFVKRSPVNLRPVLGVPRGINSKGVALFALAELSRFPVSGEAKHRENVSELLSILRSNAIRNGGRTAFGYNFDWQSRAFFAPKGTPTIVPTAFAARAFFENYKSFSYTDDLKICDEICAFILNDLNRSHETEDEICFSYTPLDRSVIFNASLLAGETLAMVGAETANEIYLETAAKAARFVIRRQRDDGAWDYGSSGSHAWVDNFHTAFILLSLHRIAKDAPSVNDEAAAAIERGMEYWLSNFFLADGTPKYFDRGVYPIDIHSAAAAIAALCELKDRDERALEMAERVADWTIKNLRDPSGFFFYQRRRFLTVKIPYIRWGQAWMAYALARLIEATN